MDFSKKRKSDDYGTTTTTIPYFSATDSDSPPSNLTLDDARKIIQPFTHDQLLTILQNAVIRHIDVLNEICRFQQADQDPTQRKLFVRGLGFETTTDRLRTVFSAYGEIEEAIVINDRVTGKSKGFGFVTFNHVDGAINALKQPSKKIDDRVAVAQLAIMGSSGSVLANNSMAVSTDTSSRKIYVGNVPTDMPSERLLGLFSSYGEIEEGPLGFDKNTGKSRGFAFIVFKTEEGARASIVDPIKHIDGHQLACKFAVDNKKVRPGGAVNADNATGMPINNGVGDRNGGMSMPAPSSMSAPQYGAQGPHGGYPDNLHGGHPLPHHQINQNSQLLPSVGGGYGIPSFGGPAPGDYGRFNNAGSEYRMPPSAGYPGSGNYGLPSPGFPPQQNPYSQGPRGPPGGMYQMPPYY